MEEITIPKCPYCDSTVGFVAKPTNLNGYAVILICCKHCNKVIAVHPQK